MNKQKLIFFAIFATSFFNDQVILGASHSSRASVRFFQMRSLIDQNKQEIAQLKSVVQKDADNERRIKTLEEDTAFWEKRLLAQLAGASASESIRK